MSEIATSENDIKIESDKPHRPVSANRKAENESPCPSLKSPPDASGFKDGSKDSEFLMRIDSETQEYFREIAMEMQTLFRISKAEAVARINEAYGHMSFKSYPDIICHEDPEHWAYGLYYGDVRYWDSDADRSTWQVRKIPPRDSPSWTIKDQDPAVNECEREIV